MRSKSFIVSLIIGMCILVMAAVVTRIHRPNELNNGKRYDNLTISFFQKDYKDLLIGMEEELCHSKVIVIAKPTGKKEYVYGNLKQEVVIKKVVRGEIPVSKGKKVQLVENGWLENSDDNKLTVATGFVNYLRKGDDYLIFGEECMKDYSGKGTILKACEDVVVMRCLNLSSNESSICNRKGEQIKYKNVKNSEFFTNDKETLEAMVKLKKA